MGDTMVPVSGVSRSRAEEKHGDQPALVIAWSEEEPHRVGEIAFFPLGGRAHVLGRGEDGDPGELRAQFYRQRPGGLEPTEPLAGTAISRRQLIIESRPFGLEIRRVGRCPVLVNGKNIENHAVAPGDTILLKRQILLHCTTRPRSMPALQHFDRDDFPFGEPDAAGILGETPLVWELRDRLAFAAKADRHVLLRGPSGTGKELAARAIHALSRRSRKPIVARNAATFPSGLIDAELFGNVKNYPNPGMPERPGLVGQADGGTLFLDEIAEFPHEMQAHLLRVLDSDGEYHRLGEALLRRADIRLVGATNRALSALKHDLLARLTMRVELPALDARREDVPLLVRHLLLRAASSSPEIGARFLRSVGGQAYPRMDAALVETFLHAPFDTNVRELDSLLWRAMSESRGNVIERPRDLALDVAPLTAPEVTPEAVRARLAEAGGNVSRAAKALGVSRYALYRCMKKFGIDEALP